MKNVESLRWCFFLSTFCVEIKFSADLFLSYEQPVNECIAVIMFNINRMFTVWSISTQGLCTSLYHCLLKKILHACVYMTSCLCLSASLPLTYMCVYLDLMCIYIEGKVYKKYIYIYIYSSYTGYPVKKEIEFSWTQTVLNSCICSVLIFGFCFFFCFVLFLLFSLAVFVWKHILWCWLQI